MSRLSKERPLTLQASVNPALLPRERNLEIAIGRGESRRGVKREVDTRELTARTT